MGRAHAHQKPHLLYLGGGILTPQGVHTLDWLLPKDKCQEISGHIEVLSVHSLGGDGVVKCSLTGLNVVSARSHA